MRLRLMTAAVSVLLVAVFCAPAFAAPTVAGRAGGGDPFTLWFDENGNGWVDEGQIGMRVPDPGFLAIDPLSGILALTYGLPEPVVPGDVGVQEFNQMGVLSDGLRFENGLYGFQAVMFYFSDLGDRDLADTGFPSGFPCCDIIEYGQQDVYDRFDWYPGGNIYHGVSDVPEPGTLLMLGTGIVGVIGAIRRKLSF